jgi:hypothetical protein
MRYRLTQGFERAYAAAAAAVQRAFDKQLRFLLQNLRHPSLGAKKYPEGGDLDLWQARITKGWRFYFRIVADTYELLEMIKHPK